MAVHGIRMVGIMLLLVLCMIYPFLPGEYDPLALPLSVAVQLLGAAGVLLVPLNVVWLAYEARAMVQRERKRTSTAWRYYLMIITLAVTTVLAVAVSLIVMFGISFVLGVFSLGGALLTVYRLFKRVRSLKNADTNGICPAPLYLVVIPVILLLFQIVLASPLTSFSRNQAIVNSRTFIEDIEAYYEVHGRYPLTLAAVWQDYYPHIAGIEKFHYSPAGESYNLFFEQPRFLFDNVGTREWVVYNPRDEHQMYSHTAWFLLLTPEELDRSPGWYAVNPIGIPHWQIFWFD